MADDHVYKMVQLIGSSPDGVDAAIRGAIDRAGETIRNLDWFEVKEIRGQLADQQVAWFQVKADVGFRVESADEVIAE